MSTKEKLNQLEELLDIEEGTLNENDVLDSIPEYDSMAKLSLIVLMDEEFNKKLTGEQILTFKTVKDILDFMA